VDDDRPPARRAGGTMHKPPHARWGSPARRLRRPHDAELAGVEAQGEG